MNASATIALLNDLARTTLTDCRLVITPGIARLDDLEAVIARVQAYNAFTPSSDPYGEHDLGSFEYGCNTVLWKFDYYDSDMVMHSPDPADPTVTCRVLTIMLAEEY